jgi:hypothetical protein
MAHIPGLLLLVGFCGLSAFVSSAFAPPLTPVFSRFARRWQELESRARERHIALDRLDAELSWYRG